MVSGPLRRTFWLQPANSLKVFVARLQSQGIILKQAEDTSDSRADRRSNKAWLKKLIRKSDLHRNLDPHNLSSDDFSLKGRAACPQEQGRQQQGQA